MRRVRLALSFRSQLLYGVIYEEIRAAKARKVRIVEHSIQEDHLHLLAEGEDEKDLSKQMCLLFSRIAMAVNRAAGRHGALFRDRHHRHALRTPTEVRNALVYILFNLRKHDARSYSPAALRTVLDGFSSAPWFTHWHPEARPPPDLLVSARAGSQPGATSEPKTWLARTGWLRAGGPIRFDELPRIPT
jgi:putative transposase